MQSEGLHDTHITQTLAIEGFDWFQFMNTFERDYGLLFGKNSYIRMLFVDNIVVFQGNK